MNLHYRKCVSISFIACNLKIEVYTWKIFCMAVENLLPVFTFYDFFITFVFNFSKLSAVKLCLFNVWSFPFNWYSIPAHFIFNQDEKCYMYITTLSYSVIHKMHNFLMKITFSVCCWSTIADRKK